MQQTILAIAGKPGLYKLVTRGNNNLIVEALDATHKRMPAQPIASHHLAISPCLPRLMMCP